MLTREDLSRLCPRPKSTGSAQDNWDGYVAALTSEAGARMMAPAFKTRETLCGFLANIAEETGDAGGFTCLWENMNFSSVSAIRKAWEKRASKHSDDWIEANLLHKPEAVADWAYGGRMGNGKGNGDGYKYRGFGPLQTTGKTDHLKYLRGDYSHLNALRAALSEWTDKGCGDHVDGGDFDAACILINGGRNGLAERRKYFSKAKVIWTEDPVWIVPETAPLPLPEVTAKDLVKQGSRSMSWLQWLKTLFVGTGAGTLGLMSSSDALSWFGWLKQIVFGDWDAMGLLSPDKIIATKGYIDALKGLLADHAGALLFSGVLAGAVMAHFAQVFLVMAARGGRYVPDVSPKGGDNDPI